MTFTPKTLDGVAAWKRALRNATARPGYCLAEVHGALGSPKSDGAYPYADATEARKRAQQLGAIRGTNLDAAPEGAILYWSNVVVKGKDLGHIALKGPNNTIITIDNPTRGRWGQVTVAAFRAKWSWLVFQGFAHGPGAYLGHTISVASNFSPVSSGTASSILLEGDDMYSDADRQRDQAVFDAVFRGGDSMLDNKRSIAASLAGIVTVVDSAPTKIARAVWGTKVQGRVGGDVDALQELADAKTITIRLEAQLSAMNAAVSALAVAKGVDPEKLSAIIATKVDAALADNFASIPDAVRANIKAAL